MASLVVGVACGQLLALLLLVVLEFVVPALFWFGAEVSWRRLSALLQVLASAVVEMWRRGGVPHAA